VLEVAAGLAVGVLPVLAGAGLLEHLNRIVVVGLMGPEKGSAPVAERTSAADLSASRTLSSSWFW
jgi:hypothetical protein